MRSWQKYRSLTNVGLIDSTNWGFAPLSGTGGERRDRITHEYDAVKRKVKVHIVGNGGCGGRTGHWDAFFEFPGIQSAAVRKFPKVRVCALTAVKEGTRWDENGWLYFEPEEDEDTVEKYMEKWKYTNRQPVIEVETSPEETYQFR